MRGPRTGNCTMPFAARALLGVLLPVLVVLNSGSHTITTTTRFATKREQI